MNKRIVYKFSDGSEIFFAQGTFDEWCVYLKNQDSSPMSPKDTQYFESLNSLRDVKDSQSIYEDFLLFYDKTNQDIEDETLSLITEISKSYGKMSNYANKLFVTIYATMIAELNKKNTKLGKRIKRLGVHKVLIENETVTLAANFMRGMNWREIDQMCRLRGF